MALTKEKLEILKRCFNVTRPDISNYRTGKFKHINKSKCAAIKLFDEGELMDCHSLKPLLLSSPNKIKPKKYLVLRGIK